MNVHENTTYVKGRQYLPTFPLLCRC
jgi:hypothetical protein